MQGSPKQPPPNPMKPSLIIAHAVQGLPVFAALTLIAVTPAAHAAAVTASVIGSNAGFGAITYTPGGNVSEFVIYGKTSALADYITSSTSTHIAKAIVGDSSIIGYDQTYTATTYNWTGGTPSATGSGYSTETFQAVGNAWGTPAFTQASIAATCPTADFTFSFLVHDYYVSTGLEVWRNGVAMQSYADVMSSSYNTGGGEARNTDFFYQFAFSGMTAGDSLEFKFYNLTNAGSPWSNIAFLSSSLNYVAPETITTNLMSMATIPEPSGALWVGLATVLMAGRRRRVR